MKLGHLLLAAALAPVLLAQSARTDEIRCKSEDFGYRECRLEGTILRARVKDRKSRAACVRGSSFGTRGDVLWVDRGCDAEFQVTYRSARGSGRYDREEESRGGRYGDSRYDPSDRLGRGPLERRELECESKDFRRATCRVDGFIERVELKDVDSSASCVRGRSWGWERDYVWVDQGCQADFEVYFRSPGRNDRPSGFRGDERRRRLACASRGFREEQCFVGGRIIDARLFRQRSRASCREGRTWGFRRDYIWVDDGCSADFEVLYLDEGRLRNDRRGRSGEIECKSEDFRYKACGGEGFIGSARVKDQKSDAPCRRGHSWGFRRDYIWVDKGCAAEFEVQYR